MIDTQLLPCLETAADMLKHTDCLIYITKALFNTSTCKLMNKGLENT